MNCFPSPTCVTHVAKMKAELRGNDTKGTHVERTLQSLYKIWCTVFPFSSLSSLLRCRWCWWHEVTRYEWIIRDYLTWHCVSPHWLTYFPYMLLTYFVSGVKLNVLLCVYERKDYNTDWQRDRKCFYSLSIVMWLWSNWLAGFCLGSLDWRLSHDEAGLKRELHWNVSISQTAGPGLKSLSLIPSQDSWCNI